jgi:hypothetical protein
MQLFQDLAAEMMRLDPFFKIHAYDRTIASDLWPLACVDDIPAMTSLQLTPLPNTILSTHNSTNRGHLCLSSSALPPNFLMLNGRNS